MQHFNHEHGLVLKEADNGSHICYDCGELISGPFCLCEDECCYDDFDIEHPIHQSRTLLPATINCCYHDHQLNLLPNQLPEIKDHVCNICYDDITTETVYSCVECLFFAHASCATLSKIQPSSLEIEIKHFSHKHRLVLNEDNSGSHKCYGCGEPISGRFYRCKRECDYYLHKVCAELPETMNHQMHPQHPLTLLAESPYKSGTLVCDMCRMSNTDNKFVYNCSICSFDLDMICAIPSHTIEDKCHMHPLTPVLLSSSFLCNICHKKEEGVSYKCSVCPFCVHQKCTLLPGTVKCSDHDHQLTLLPSIPNRFHEKLDFKCNICKSRMTTYETVYACIGCLFFAHASCATSSKIQPSSTSSLKIEMNHFSHEHLLLLKKAEELKSNHRCVGCFESISGPFYSCKEECDYYLHKVCAELPKTMNHPMHPEHPLTHTVYARSLFELNRDTCECSLCGKRARWDIFVYICSLCSFTLDIICVIASYTIEDKCHMHPLIPIPLSASFPCNICRKKEEGVSYKCSICPFWVHQNCTFLPDTVECGNHDDQLALLPSIPTELHKKLQLPDRDHSLICDICHDRMNANEAVYSCIQCLFFTHASCATSSNNQPSRDENNVIDLKTKFLPLRKDWTSLISLIVGNDGECAECEELISDCKCCNKLSEHIPNLNKILDYEVHHFSHEHMLHLLDNDKVCGKVCEACAEPISDPSYGCSQCDYSLHKCCIDLPEKISHPFHSKHDIKLFARYSKKKLGMFQCMCCFQLCNTFGYKCDDTKCNFKIDLKCASLSGRIKHEAHKHTLSSNSVTKMNENDKCSSCTVEDIRLGLKCAACKLSLCLYCTMLPAIVNHRYCKCKGFKFRYSPLKDYHTEYYCDLCERTLQPKFWFYHCSDCDQFAHATCLIYNACNSNIKFGRSYSLPEHEHMLILTRFTYEYSNCKICVTSLNKGRAIGFKCATCPYFKIHLTCVKKWL